MRTKKTQEYSDEMRPAAAPQQESGEAPASTFTLIVKRADPTRELFTLSVTLRERPHPELRPLLRNPKAVYPAMTFDDFEVGGDISICFTEEDVALTGIGKSDRLTLLPRTTRGLARGLGIVKRVGVDLPEILAHFRATVESIDGRTVTVRLFRGAIEFRELQAFEHPDHHRLNLLVDDGFNRIEKLVVGVELELELAAQEGGRARRLRFLRSADDAPDGPDYLLWELVSCENRPDLEDPLQLVDAQLAGLSDPLFPVRVLDIEGAVPSRVFLHTRPDPAAPATDTIGALVFRPMVWLWFVNDRYPTRWLPGRLFIDQAGTELTFDAESALTPITPARRLAGTEVEFSWTRAQTAGDPADFEISWLPTLYCSGTTSAIANEVSYLWHLGHIEGDAANVAGWIRYNLTDGFRLVDRPVDNEHVAAGLTHPFVVKHKEWTFELAPKSTAPPTPPADPGDQPGNTDLQVVITLGARDVVQTIEVLFRTRARDHAAIEVTTPPLHAYEGRLHDPASLPPDWNPADRIRLTSLVFRSSRQGGSVADLHLVSGGSGFVGPAPGTLEFDNHHTDGLGASGTFTIKSGEVDAVQLDPQSRGGGYRNAPACSATPDTQPGAPPHVLVRVQLRKEDFQGIVAVLDRTGWSAARFQPFEFSCEADAVEAFRAIDYSEFQHALVDPVSPTGGNLRPVEQPEGAPLLRDPNRGLANLPVEGSFGISFVPTSDLGENLVNLTVAGSTVVLPSGALALLPWVEFDATDGHQNLHHRNLILEHDEFAAARRDSSTDLRNGVQPVSYSEFVDAVRDRYTLADANLSDGIANLVHWARGLEIDRTLTFGYNQALSEVPKLTVTYTDDGGTARQQSLSLIRGGDPVPNWLQFEVAWDKVSTTETLKVAPVGTNTYRDVAANSALPLLFQDSKSYDNAGVVREPAVPAPPSSPSYVANFRPIESLFDGQSYKSVSLDATLLPFVPDTGSEVCFHCQGLLLDDNGKPIEAANHPSGKRYGFYSKHWANANLPIHQAARWPRISWVFLYPLALKRLELDGNTNAWTSITFEAVIPNPTLLDAQPAARGEVPHFVSESASQRTIHVKITRGGAVSVVADPDDPQQTSRVFWSFRPQANAVNGSIGLAQLEAQVSYDAGIGAFHLINPSVQAQILGENREAENPQTLTSSGDTEWFQFGFGVRPSRFRGARRTDFRRLIISTREDPSFAFSVKLPTAKPFVTLNAQLDSQATPPETLNLIATVGELGKEVDFEAHAELSVGPYHGFRLSGPGGTGGLLLLWNEEQTLHWQVLIEEFKRDALADVYTDPRPLRALRLSGPQLLQRFHSSVRSREHKLMSWLLEYRPHPDRDAVITLQIAPQSVAVAKATVPLTAHLSFARGNRQFQGPVQLEMQDDQRDVQQFVLPNAVNYLNPVAVAPREGALPEIAYPSPGIVGSEPVFFSDEIRLLEGGSVRAGFVSLAFDRDAPAQEQFATTNVRTAAFVGETQLVTGTSQKLQLWKRAQPSGQTNNPQDILNGEEVLRAAASPNGAFIAAITKTSVAKPYHLRIWETSTLTLLAHKDSARELTSLSFAERGTETLLLVGPDPAGGGDHNLRLFAINNGTVSDSPFVLSIDNCNRQVAFSSDGQRFICGGPGGNLLLCQLDPPQVLDTFSVANLSIHSVAFSASQQHIMCTGTHRGHHDAFLWQISNSQPFNFASGALKLLSADFSPDGRQIAVLNGTGAVSLYNLGAVLQGQPALSREINPAGFSLPGEVRFSPQGTELLVVGGRARLIDLYITFVDEGNERPAGNPEAGNPYLVSHDYCLDETAVTQPPKTAKTVMQLIHRDIAGQRLRLQIASPGEFVVFYEGRPARPLAAYASATDVQTELRRVQGLENVKVEADSAGGPFRVIFLQGSHPSRLGVASSEGLRAEVVAPRGDADLELQVIRLGAPQPIRRDTKDKRDFHTRAADHWLLAPLVKTGLPHSVTQPDGQRDFGDVLLLQELIWLRRGEQPTDFLTENVLLFARGAEPACLISLTSRKAQSMQPIPPWVHELLATVNPDSLAAYRALQAGDITGAGQYRFVPHRGSEIAAFELPDGETHRFLSSPPVATTTDPRMMLPEAAYDYSVDTGAGYELTDPAVIPAPPLFHLKVAGEITEPVAYDADPTTLAQSIQTELRLLDNGEGATVQYLNGKFAVVFQSDLGLLTAISDARLQIDVTSNGASHELTITVVHSNATTYELIYGGDRTAPLAARAPAQIVMARLSEIDALRNNVDVRQEPDGIKIEFINGLSNTAVDMLGVVVQGRFDVRVSRIRAGDAVQRKNEIQQLNVVVRDPTRTVVYRHGQPKQRLNEAEPNCHLLEATAFRDMPGTWADPRDVPAPFDLFLPENLEVECGADKPGGMLYHHLQTRRHDLFGTAMWKLDSPLDCALRDPQRFTPPRGAAIEIQQAIVKPELPRFNHSGEFRTVSIDWKDVIGEVTIEQGAEQLVTAEDSFEPLASDPTKYHFPKDFLVPVVVLDQGILKVGRGPGDFPVQPAEPGKAPLIFLVTRDPNLFDGFDDPEFQPDRQNPRLAPMYNPKLRISGGDFPLNCYFELLGTSGAFTLYRARARDWSSFYASQDLNFVWIHADDENVEEKDQRRAFLWADEQAESQAKRVKQITKSALSPKTSLVMDLEEGINHQRETLLFGPAAPLSQGTPSMIQVSIGGIPARLFRFSVKDQAERLLRLPPTNVDKEARLFVVKYLINGETIYDVSEPVKLIHPTNA